jgi:putative transcriptional regulator
MQQIVDNCLYELRTERGMTQEAVADAAGVSRQTIIAIEKGKYSPSVALALRLASTFGIKVEDLFSLRGRK